jgi:hypothetical protein
MSQLRCPYLEAATAGSGPLNSEVSLYVCSSRFQDYFSV